MCTKDCFCNCDGACIEPHGAITWTVRFLLGYVVIAFVILLAMWANTAFAAPADLEAVKQSVDSRYTYDFRMTRGVDEWNREDGTANCAKYTVEYTKALIGAGYGLSRLDGIECLTPDDMPHVYLLVDGKWVLDNRKGAVIGINEQDCK